jgi:hypothetical protein
LAQQEELQLGQQTAEVIKSCEKAEIARKEALTWGRQLRIGLLVGRLDLGLWEGQISQILLEAFQEGLRRPSNGQHHQHNSRAKHHQLPQHRRKGHQEAKRQQEPRGCPDHQEGRQEGNHHKDHREDHRGVSHKQWHRNKSGKRPRGPVKP